MALILKRYSMQELYMLDDDEDILFSLHYYFTRVGYRVSTFKNSFLLYQAIIITLPDVLLLDVQLFGEDGRSISLHLKNKLHHLFPIVLFSANQSLKETFKNYLADAFIEKPFTLKAISDLIRLVAPAKA